MKRLEVTSCSNCPFHPDSEYGYGYCLHPNLERGQGPAVEDRPNLDKRALGCPLEIETVEVVPA
jgi:hypothetical protein